MIRKKRNLCGTDGTGLTKSTLSWTVGVPDQKCQKTKEPNQQKQKSPIKWRNAMFQDHPGHARAFAIMAVAVAAMTPQGETS